MKLDELHVQVREKWKLRQERWSIEHNDTILEPEHYLTTEEIQLTHFLFPFVKEDRIQYNEYNRIYEGLITSQSAQDVLNYIKRHFPTIYCALNKEANNNVPVIVLSFTVMSDKDFVFLLKIINNLGWECSQYNVNNTTWNKFDNSTITNLIQKPFDIVYIQLEAKFDIEEHEIPDKLYHATPTSHIQKIQQIGIIPKTKNNTTAYTDRIYVAINYNNLEQKLLPHMAEESNQKNWTILSINTSPTIHPNIRWFKDPNFPYGYYTLTNIPPTRLQIIKQIQL